MLRKYDHIIWDWNGTLVDDVDLCVTILNKILPDYDLPLTSRRQYVEDFSHPVKDYYCGLGFDFSKCSFDDIAVFFNAEYVRLRAFCKLQGSSEYALNQLSKAGYQQSILSAYQQHRLEESVDIYNLRKFFVKIAGLGDHYASSKIERGKELLRDLKADPAKTLMIGDTVHDFEVAQSIGSDCVLLGNGHNKKERLENCNVPVYDSIKEILTVLLSEN
jgi:phosphoglycolate phosphatase